jgi:RimJ/RimL family protein N-acetyltransferase
MGEEAARTVLRYAFDRLQVTELTAGHKPPNLDSKSLIEKLGFACQSEFARSGLLRRHILDFHYFRAACFIKTNHF